MKFSNYTQTDKKISGKNHYLKKITKIDKLIYKIALLHFYSFYFKQKAAFCDSL